MDMTNEERMRLREEYKASQMKRVDVTAKKQHIYGKEDMLNLPRHQTNCADFQECPLCYKCRNFDSSKLKCVHCSLTKQGSICNKAKHTEQILEMMIRRERIEVEDEKHSHV